MQKKEHAEIYEELKKFKVLHLRELARDLELPEVRERSRLINDVIRALKEQGRQYHVVGGRPVLKPKKTEHARK
jgi:hypothetical protein